MNNDTPSIGIVIAYFGKWPEWIDFFLESCRYNPTIDWILYTDCGVRDRSPSNVKYKPMSFSEYKRLAESKLSIDCSQMTPYKLCDFKPAYGYVHEEDLKGYDFFGFGDIDLVYGDIRSIITNDVLKHNVVSTHSDRISGHFALFRNSEKYRKAFMKAPKWKEILASPKHFGFDESAFSKLFRRRKKASKLFFILMRLMDSFHRNIYFKEQYTTILAPIPWVDGSEDHPVEWYWSEGKLTNIKDKDREFLYIHFMNLKSDKWLPLDRHPAKWTQVDSIIKRNFSPDWKGFVLNDKGFHEL